MGAKCVLILFLIFEYRNKKQEPKRLKSPSFSIYTCLGYKRMVGSWFAKLIKMSILFKHPPIAEVSSGKKLVVGLGN